MIGLIMYRTRQFRRHHRRRTINRKKKFIRLANGYWHYQHEGTLDKGKIHCSCWMCRYETTHGILEHKRSRLRDIDFMEQLEYATLAMMVHAGD